MTRFTPCRYNEDLDGVLLSYSSERILTHQAHIHPYFPLVRVEVAADAVLFRPQAGMRLGKHGCQPRMMEVAAMYHPVVVTGLWHAPALVVSSNSVTGCYW